ncbi:hypothetical protein WN943_026861 [Citrus x changshan-huyou]
MRLATCSTDMYSSLEPKSSFGNRFWRVFFLHHVLPHMNSLAVSHFVCKEKENCISGFLFGKAKVRMNYEDDTTVCVTFKDTTHNLGVIDLDRFSKVSLINKSLLHTENPHYTVTTPASPAASTSQPMTEADEAKYQQAEAYLDQRQRRRHKRQYEKATGDVSPSRYPSTP